MADDIRQWLEDLGLGGYAEAFAENFVDFDVLPRLTNDDLKDIGVAAVGHRRKLLDAIAVFARQDNGPTRDVDEPGHKSNEPAPSVEALRRQVTVLFADISGFTALSSRLDAEETHALLNEFFTVVDDVVGGYGGNIDKHIGDAVMAVFGAPVAHTDDPERALRAALDIHDAVARLDPPLRVHIGIASGQVVASSIGSAAHTEYTVTGDSVNLASRLTDRAKAGETLASTSVQRALGERFMGVCLGEQAVDGLLEPVTVWRLDELGAGRRQGGNAFVGRKRELTQFSATLDNCMETGTGETVIVRGEAGIGKTRLVEEFASLAATKGFAVHTGLVLDFGTAKGQDAVRALVRSLLDIPAGGDKAVRFEAAALAVRTGRLPEAQRVYLNDLLDLPQPPDLNGLYEAMDNETRNRGKRDVFGGLVRTLSQSTPLLLRVEDTHWADPVILAYLAFLTRAISEYPVLLILTTRIAGDQLDQGWRTGTEGAPLTTIDLGQLEPSEAIDLARDFDALDSEIIAACIDRSGGNPLFLEQLLRNADDLTSGDIPGTIQGIVQARLDILPASDRKAIQAASILGQRFSRPAMDALLDIKGYDPTNLLKNVLIRPADNDYHFAHALIREGTYASMLRPQRTELHRRAAAWFQGGDPVLHAEHLDKAEEPGAAEAYLDAARQEAKTHRHERAIRLVERALQLDSVPEVRFDMTCVHGDLLRELGQADQSITAFGQALEAATKEVQICRANVGLAEGLRIGARYRDGLERLTAAEVAAEAIGSAEYLTRVHRLKGNFYFPMGEIDQCMAEHEKALHYGSKTGSAEAKARALSGVADAHYLRGRMLSAAQMFERCVALAKENNLVSIVSANLAMIGHTKIYALDLQTARAAADEASELSSTIGDYRAESLAQFATSYVLIEEASFDEALANSQAAVDLAQEYGMDAFLAGALRHRSSIFLEIGQREKAIELAERAWNVTVENHFERFTGSWCLSIIARSSPDKDRQIWAIEQGFRLLSEGAASHSHFFFYRDIMEAGLERGDWALMKRACDALAGYTRAEPLPWSVLHIARARALSDFHQGHDRNKAVEVLRKLKAQAEKVGLKVVLPPIEAVLGEVGH